MVVQLDDTDGRLVGLLDTLEAYFAGGDVGSAHVDYGGRRYVIHVPAPEADAAAPA